MEELEFEVAFIPKAVKDSSQICVLIDVLRATSAMVTMLDKGCTEIILTSDEKKTMKGTPVHKLNETLVCAEELDGRVSKDAQFSPSLISIRPMNLNNKRVILKTTNGTLAGITLWNAGIKQILIGALHNAKAVMEKAVKLAIESKKNITIVCAGRESGRIIAIDDVFTAGTLIEYGKEIAHSLNRNPILKDSAKISQHLLSVYPNAITSFEDSGSGETMRRINTIEDIKICSEENISTIAPMLDFNDEDGFIVTKNTNEVVYK
ncbi:2-phosphosulfolactate phosphatase [Neobacillus soli]|uniref:2-phosphosulfolactate phosphatase n=1 Tax=Neobacillus soli TaxID=220688 RepID=UPI0008258A11|nr:2-phosphosulfolactate phosphatase [Neobacillus soli]